jgi:hypothetical protein
MKKSFIFLLILCCSGITGLRAQYMKNSVGIRTGISEGFTYQRFVQEDRDIKLLLSFRDNGMQMSFLTSSYESVGGRFRDNIYLYYGLGVHAGFSRNLDLLWHFTGRNNTDASPVTRALAGADGLIGLEYRVYTVPLSFGLEYKPFFDLFGHRIFRLSYGDLGLTCRYHF